MVDVTVDIDVYRLDEVSSTQDAVLKHLRDAEPELVVAVAARRQRAGRGRDGRAWEDPPGDGLLVSIGTAASSVDVLDDLPRRVAACVQRSVDDPAARVAWKAPNDLVDATTGAKVAGILVDARTSGARLEHVIVGVGINVSGPAFSTSDGRDATTLEQLGASLDADGLVQQVAALLVSERR